jgi:hypothetical protein
MSELNQDVSSQLRTDLEKKVISFVAVEKEWKDINVTRKSDAEWDFTVSGMQGFGLTKPSPEDKFVQFQADPKLALIREAEWPDYSELSDYPTMVESGDWSGIRDSCKEARDVMFIAALEDFGFIPKAIPGFR